ncbi:MAG TPA: pteridine reductase [Steroidobacteraceae bacterium]|jgi:pteridine reductase|nr:pteridine reductase [Steroidobacteraceae bacterium]
MNNDTATRDLRGRTALVTGGARRVGARIVQVLHAAGANVVIHCHRSRDSAERLATQLQADRPASAAVVSADLMDIGQLSQLVQACHDRFGGLDILVNNASTFYPTPIGSMTATQWDDLMGTNLRAPMFLAQAAAGELKRSRGLILNLVDIHGMRPLRDHLIYSSAKAALIMLTRGLARELAPEVRVNGIAPGPVMWPEGGLDDERKAEILNRTPLHRAGSPDDIASAALFFATGAPFVTGQILAVDGGRSIGW